jgi:NAD-dependent DNA ligase
MTEPIELNIVTASRLLKRSCESLIGICSGLIADGDLNDREIVFLSTWLSENEAISRTWPGEVVFARVREVMADGIITPEERAYLVSTLEQLAGGSFAETGAVGFNSNALPTDDSVEIEIPGRLFCFTGQFLFGTRAACEKAIGARGGEAASNITKKTHYLVIGELASRSWKNTSHGTKIENAVHLQSQGASIQIISEALWVRKLA